MELAYPFILIIGIPILIILSLINLKKKTVYKDGKKVANTIYTRNTDYFKKMLKKYKVISYFIKGLCLTSIIVALFLLSRPSKLQSSEKRQYNRDIFLCLDVSTSVVDLDGDLVSEIKEMVKKLKGERIGITIFNTSSNLLIPLTNDYEYVLETLDKLEESLKSYSSDNYFEGDSIHKQKFTESGTLVGNEERGSSIIGDGLASCIFSFPNLEEERTRIIIFSTDNDDASTSKPIVTLEEAGEIAKERGIIVYGICPELTQDKDERELRKAVETTGGELFNENSSETVSKLVSKIEETQKTEIKGTKETKLVDKPEIPFVFLVFSIIILFVVNKKVKI